MYYMVKIQTKSDGKRFLKLGNYTFKTDKE
jgi:hypothetical protein